jgi:hypothetical protein
MTISPPLLDAIQKSLLPLLAGQSRCWHDDIMPRLNASGILIHSYLSLDTGEG